MQPKRKQAFREKIRSKKSVGVPSTQKKYAIQKPGIERTGGYYGRYNLSAGLGSIEKKWIDLTVAATVVTNDGTGGISSWTTGGTMNVIATGTGESQRVGRKVTLKNIYLHGELVLPSTSSVTLCTDQFRMIVFIDKQANGVIAGVTDVLQTASINSFRNLANQERFVILKDKYYDINASTTSNATTTTGGHSYHIKMYKKLDLPIEYSGTNGTIGEIKSNNLVMLCISRTGSCTFQYTARIRYTDV